VPAYDGGALTMARALRLSWYGRAAVEPPRGKSFVRTFGQPEDVNVGNHRSIDA
jgi:hypothetical protein